MQNKMRLLISLFCAVSINLSISGCGNGSGALATSVATDNSGTTLTLNGSGTTLMSCTRESYLPNFSNLIPLYHWQKFPLKVYFSNSGVVTQADGSQVDLAPIALNGFQEWKNATADGVEFELTTNSSLADVVVHFGLLDRSPTAYEFLGIEQSCVFQDGSMKHADILLNTWAGMSDANISSFQETSAHEFGHALGMNGHSDDLSDVMFTAHLIDSMKSLTTRDINSLKTAYCGQFGRSTSLRSSVNVFTINN